MKLAVSSSRMGMSIMLYFPKHQEQINTRCLICVKHFFMEIKGEYYPPLPPIIYFTLFPLASDAPENFGLLTAVMNAEASR